MDNLVKEIYAGSQPKKLKEVTLVLAYEKCQPYMDSKGMTTEDAKAKFMKDRAEAMKKVIFNL
jgi:hypothetical protein